MAKVVFFKVSSEVWVVLWPCCKRLGSDDSDLEEVYNTERHLLYVACTRARDRLLVSSTAPRSEFIDDLLS